MMMETSVAEVGYWLKLVVAASSIEVSIIFDSHIVVCMVLIIFWLYCELRAVNK